MTIRPLHVLVYTDSAGIGGAEMSLGHLVAHVSDSFRITVAGVSPGVIEFVARQRPRTDSILMPVRGPQMFFAHLRSFIRHSPDIIHCNLCTPWAGATALTVALLLPRTRVVRVDQLPLRTTDAISLWRTRMLCLRVDAHIAVGEASARRMEDFYALGRGSVRSIPNGVPDRLAATPLPHRSPGELVVGSVGRLDAMKAHDVLLRAAAQVTGVHVVIWGEGAERSALEQLIRELGIADRVDLPGWIEQPQSQLFNFDVIALPSRSEGFPLAMVEAMLAARPVIATRVGSMPEAIIDGETGLLIEKNDVVGLAQALQRLRDDPALRIRLGTQARQKALTHFTATAMARQYEQLWQQVCNHPRLPRLRVPRPKD